MLPILVVLAGLWVFLASSGSSERGSGDEDPTWSPDGALVAYSHWESSSGTLQRTVDKNEIWVIDPTGIAKKLADHGWSPDWSPDGKQIVFARKTGLAVMDASGRELHGVPSVSNAAGPDWSPDGGRLAFSSTDEPGGVFVVRLDGTGLRRITTGRDSEPDWSPDGRRIVFAHTLEHGGDEITVIGFDGDERRVVAVGGHDGASPVWSPNGEWIAYVFHDLQSVAISDIFLVASSGTGHPKPTGACLVSGELCSDPAWSPDGKKIAYVASGDETHFVSEIRYSRVSLPR